MPGPDHPVDGPVDSPIDSPIGTDPGAPTGAEAELPSLTPVSTLEPVDLVAADGGAPVAGRQARTGRLGVLGTMALVAPWIFGPVFGPFTATTVTARRTSSGCGDLTSCSIRHSNCHAWWPVNSARFFTASV